MLRDLGAAIAPQNSFNLIQGLETLPLRLKQHNSNAEQVADLLKAHEQISKITFPKFAQGKSKENADKYLNGNYGSMIGIELKNGVQGGKAFIDALASGVNEPRSGLEQVLAFWREPGGAYSMSSNAFNTDPNSGLLDPEKSFTDIAYQAVDVPRILPTGEVVVTAYDPDLVVNQAKRLSRSGRLGDLVIFMQERLAQKPFSEWRDEDVYAAIEPMAYIGLRPEARALAKEIILQKALSDLVANENSNENSKARPISPDRTDLSNGSARQQAMPRQ